jgi:hypothetical protein
MSNMSNEETVRAACLPVLIVANIAVRQDEDGHYSLNDLHKASGGEAKYRPNQFLRNDKTQALIAESENAQICAFKTQRGVDGGTYACRELVYAYAMWISPKFSLMVIRAFDALVTGQRPEIGPGIPQVVERAVEAISLRTAMKARDRTLTVFGSLADEEDKELAWQVSVRAKERIAQHLHQLAKRHLKNHGPEQVAAWIMAWAPEKVAGVLH